MISFIKSVLDPPAQALRVGQMVSVYPHTRPPAIIVLVEETRVKVYTRETRKYEWVLNNEIRIIG